MESHHCKREQSTTLTLAVQLTSLTSRRSMFDILNEVAQKDEKGVYSLKWKQPKNEPVTSYQPQSQPQNTQTFAPPNVVPAPSSLPSAISQDDIKPKPKVKLVAAKNPDAAETPVAVVKGKKNPSINAPAPAPSPAPAPEQRKMNSVVPGVNRTPVETTAVPTRSPHPPPQFVPQPKPPSTSPHPPRVPSAPPPTANGKKRGVLKKPEDQAVQPPAHPQPQPQQPNPSVSDSSSILCVFYGTLMRIVLLRNRTRKQIPGNPLSLLHSIYHNHLKKSNPPRNNRSRPHLTTLTPLFRVLQTAVVILRARGTRIPALWCNIQI